MDRPRGNHARRSWGGFAPGASTADNWPLRTSAAAPPDRFRDGVLFILEIKALGVAVEIVFSFSIDSFIYRVLIHVAKPVHGGKLFAMMSGEKRPAQTAFGTTSQLVVKRKKSDNEIKADTSVVKSSGANGGALVQSVCV